jgi:transposase
VAFGRKNHLFAGSDKGGERATAIYRLIQTVRLDFVDPEAWLHDVLTRVACGHPANRIGELALWHFPQGVCSQ